MKFLTAFLDDTQRAIGEWGEQKYPGELTVEMVDRFVIEVSELLETPLEQNLDGVVRDKTADVFIALLQFAHRRGFSLHDATATRMAYQWPRKQISG